MQKYSGKFSEPLTMNSMFFSITLFFMLSTQFYYSVNIAAHHNNSIMKTDIRCIDIIVNTILWGQYCTQMGTCVIYYPIWNHILHIHGMLIWYMDYGKNENFLLYEEACCIDWWQKFMVDLFFIVFLVIMLFYIYF